MYEMRLGKPFKNNTKTPGTLKSLEVDELLICGYQAFHNILMRGESLPRP
jgi:hypothetical protein